jgi:3-hydroxyisobutyrate dehydrogenase-like beta-hydroxyacid dehydrogenase
VKVAFCGLGNMGSPMALRVLDAGHHLTVWNRTTDRALSLRGRGASVADTPAEAARGAEVVITMLSDDDALEAVVFGPHGLVEGLEAGSVVIDMSTVAPDTARSLAARVPADVEALEAPVKGGPARAAEGKLRILVGGDAGAFQRVSPLLSAMGEPRLVGPTGSAAAAKVLNNYAVITLVSVMGEALLLADALELDEDVALEILRGTPLGATVEHQWPRATGASPTSFRMRLAAKDLGLAVDAASSSSRRLAIGGEALSRLEAAIAHGMGDEDQARVIHHLRELAGEG